MKPNFAHLLVLVMISLLLHSVVHAGPWTRKRGSGFLQVGFSAFGYDRVYNDLGEKIAAGADVRNDALTFFGEFGVSDRVTLSVIVPWKFVSAERTGPGSMVPAPAKITNRGIGDIDAGLRWNWFESDGYVASGEILFGLPTGDSRDIHGLLLSDGEFNVAPRLLLGRSFYPVPAYVAADLAFNFRGSGFSNELLYSLEFGYGLFDGRLYVVLLVSGKESLSTIPSVTPSQFPAAALGFSTNNQEWAAIIPKLLYHISDGLGVAVSYATAAHGRNVGAAAVLSAGLFYEF